MKLKYKILWIENEQDWVESIEDQIQEYLEELGFIYEMKLIDKEVSGIDYNDYDIILMDLNLADQPNGADLISKIRGLDVYTDVVFYSASGITELRTKGKEKELEGVFYCGRTPNREFVNKVKAVINSTIKKVQDLNNLRGLVMAEVSELDAMMDEIILSYFKNEERMIQFHAHVTKNQEERARKILHCPNKCESDWRTKDITEIILDAAQKARAVKLVIEDKGKNLYSGPNFYEEYNNDIISQRNNLAHCKSVDGVLKTRKGDKEYTENDFKTIRKNIQKYHELFANILEIL
jgi:DNA-binding response OmpR family regulator